MYMYVCMYIKKKINKYWPLRARLDDISEQKEAAPRPLLSLTAGLCWILFPRQRFQLNEALLVLSNISWLAAVASCGENKFKVCFIFFLQSSVLISRTHMLHCRPVLSTSSQQVDRGNALLSEKRGLSKFVTGALI